MWKTAPTGYYPQTVAHNTVGILYQEPAFTQDQNNNYWLADLEVQLGANPATGGIALYQRTAGHWGSVTVGIPNNTMPPNPGPSQAQFNATGTNSFAHAPRPVYVAATPNMNMIGTIGQLYQTATPNASVDCLYWTLITGGSGSTTTTTNTQELSQYSGAPMTTCNLPGEQNAYPDTAFSVATDLTTGDQYLGFVSAYPAGSMTDAVYAMSYTGSTNTWNTMGQTLNYNNNGNTVYVKSVFATAGAKNYSYMIVNNGSIPGTPPTPPSLELFASPSLAVQANTKYYPIDNLTYGDSGNFSNPRIEAPQYITYAQAIKTVPIWLQYTSAATGNPQSLLYWSFVPN